MTYNASTNSLAIRSAESLRVISVNSSASNSNAVFSATAAFASLTTIVKQDDISFQISNVNSPAATGIQMTQISGPTPNYTIVQIISQVQSWGS